MIKKTILLFSVIGMSALAQNKYKGISDDFEDGVLAETWVGNDKFELYENKKRLQINMKDANETDSFVWSLGQGIDLSGDSKFKFKIKSGVPLSLFIELIDQKGNSSGKKSVKHTGDLIAREDSVLFTKVSGFDFKSIKKVQFSVKAEDETALGILYLDDVKLGVGGPQNGDPNPYPLSYDIRLNQVGFYPAGPKLAVIKEPVDLTFTVAKLPDYKEVFKGKLS